PNTDLDKFLVVRISRDQHLIYDATLSALQWRRHISPCMCSCPLTEFFTVWWDRCRLSDDYVLSNDIGAWGNQAIVFELFVRPMLHAKSVFARRLLKLFQLLNATFLLEVHVASIIYTPEKATIN